MRTILTNYFKAAFPCVAIQTTEEARACADVVAAAKSLDRGIVTWSATEGAVDVGKGGQQVPDSEDLSALCRLRRQKTVWILRDPHTWPFDRDPILLRAFRDFIQVAPESGSTVVVLAHEFKPHPTVEKLVTVLDYTLPSPEDLHTIAVGIAESVGKPLDPSDDVIRALGGLTTAGAENALSLALIETGAFCPKIIYREKVKAVKASGLLEVVTPDPRGAAAMGGGDVLKSWTQRRVRSFSAKGSAFGLPPSKGVLLVGPPGTGKTLYGKLVATVLGRPLLKLDLGSMFNSLVGESERRLRDALALADAQSPCVLLIDEIDKGMAGSTGSGAGDSGVSKRLLGTALTWMQEHTSSVFVIATANDISNMDPAMLRKGRFDEIFCVDLPSLSERAEILGIHLAARGRDASGFDLAAVAEVSEGFTGSEVEATLNEALFAAFDADREVTTADLVAAARAIVPLSVTAKGQIDALREWSKGRTKFASTQPAPAVPQARRLG